DPEGGRDAAAGAGDHHDHRGVGQGDRGGTDPGGEGALMDPSRVRALLEDVAAGRIAIDAALDSLRHMPSRELPAVATVDTHRPLRTGAPEVIFGLGKTGDEIATIMAELAATGANVLATRVDAAKGAEVCARVPAARAHARAQCVVVEQQPFVDRGRGIVRVVTAGTSDMGVAEEAVLTLRLLGHRAEIIHDVAVAGVHRTLARLDALRP